MNTQNHNQQPNRHNNQQREPKPTQNHRAGTDTALDAPVAEILSDLRRGYGGGVLPEDADEDEDGGDEDEGEGDLGDGTGGEWFDVDVGTGAGVVFFVPAREGGEKEEGYEGEDDGDDEQVWEYYTVLERIGDPDQIQRILIDTDRFGQQRRIVRAEETSSVGVDTDSKISDSYFQMCVANEIGYRRADAGIDLGWVVCGRVHLVVEGYEEDVGYRGGGRGTTC